MLNPGACPRMGRINRDRIKTLQAALLVLFLSGAGNPMACEPTGERKPDASLPALFEIITEQEREQPELQTDALQAWKREHPGDSLIVRLTPGYAQTNEQGWFQKVVKNEDAGNTGNTRFILPLPEGGSAEVTLSYIEHGDNGDIIASGEIDSESDSEVVLVISNKRITGTIDGAVGLFAIQALGENGLHAIYRKGDSLPEHPQ